ncbi:MAG TPA: hypothetical protein VGI79_20640 [Caulobacteraceae bacterium]
MKRANHHHRPGCRRGGEIDVHHHIVCRHNIEIEVWPPRAQINFQDDWTANPADTQVRFEAQVYNSSQGHLWEVRALNGDPGLGTIDASGLYRAPPKGAFDNSATEIVVVTAREDPLRKASAWVTLVGGGPQPAAQPSLAVWPRRVDLYYVQGANNNYIDDCNKECEFSVDIYDSNGQVEWLVNGALQGVVGPWFFYQAPNSGAPTVVTVRARLQGQPGVFDEAKILQRNYNWPGA